MSFLVRKSFDLFSAALREVNQLSNVARAVDLFSLFIGDNVGA